MTARPERSETEGKGPIRWMARNHVAANLMMWVLLLGGLAAGWRIKKEVFPDFDLDMVSVVVPYPGASPDEVEKGIVLAIEEAVRGIDGTDEITSSAREGVGTVTIELLLTADAQKVYQEIRQEVDRITTFPEEAEEPRVNLVSRKRGVVSLILHGNVSEEGLKALAEQVRDRLLRNPSITQAEVEGTRPPEVAVSVSRDTLRTYNLTLQDIAAKIRASALELPGGGIKTEGGEILLRVRERKDFAEEFGRIPIIPLAEGGALLLRDIANVRDTFEDIDRFASYDGEPAVRIEVYRVGMQTPTRVSDAAREVVAEMQGELPPGLSIAVLNDRSEMYRQRARLLLKNGTIGLTLVVVLLGVFLEARLAFWVAMGIPVSFLGGALLMPALGLSINMLTMFAFLIALGIVVDDAIVVGENVYEYHQRGLPFLQAAVRGCREVAMPVTFSVLTNVVTFIPLLFVPGTIGKIWRNIPMVVCTVFIISLGECLFILPAHLGHGGDGLRRGIFALPHRAQQAFSHWFSGMIRKVYGPFLGFVLTCRYITFAIGIAILLGVVGLVIGKRIPTEVMPRVDSDYATVTAVLPYGSAVAKSRLIRDRLVESARKAAAEVESESGGTMLEGINAEIGGSFRGISGGHVVEVRAYLTGPDIRPMQTPEFTRLWRERTGPLSGLEAIVFEADRGGPGGGAAITVELSHANTEILDAASTDLAEILAGFPIVSDIDDGFAPGKVQFDFRVRPEGEALGLTGMEIARQVRNAFYGAEALRQQRGRDEIKVKVRLPESERVSEFDIEELLIRTPAGTDVPLREVAAAVRGRAYSTIDRRNGRRTVTVSANVNPPKASGRILDSLKEEALPLLADKYPGLGFSFEGRQRAFAESNRSLAIGFAVAVFVIYALLAIPFGSYIQPMIIMVSIPFGIVGAVFGHMLLGYSLSVISMMGIVALSGVVVNDALVLIDFANRERRTGCTPREAMLSAGVRRFRPIMLTTLTTFGGLAPMIWEQSRQARFMIPMAISLGFGILFSTAITLVLIPSLYLITEDVRNTWGFIWRRRSRAPVGMPVTPDEAEAEPY